MPPANPVQTRPSRWTRLRSVAGSMPTLVVGGLITGMLLFAVLWLSQRGERSAGTGIDEDGGRVLPRVFSPLPTPTAGAVRPGVGTGAAGPPVRGAPSAEESTTPLAQAVPPAPEPIPESLPPAQASPDAALAPVSEPVPLSMPAPHFPPAALRRGAVGEVLLQVQVDADGAPASVEVIQSSGSRDLDRSAVEAAGRWRFRPATRDGVAVSGVVNVPIRFDGGG